MRKARFVHQRKRRCDFYTSGQSDPEGTVVTFNQVSVDSGSATVTATSSGTATDKIFIAIQVSQP